MNRFSKTWKRFKRRLHFIYLKKIRCFFFFWKKWVQVEIFFLYFSQDYFRLNLLGKRIYNKHKSTYFFFCFLRYSFSRNSKDVRSTAYLTILIDFYFYFYFWPRWEIYTRSIRDMLRLQNLFFFPYINNSFWLEVGGKFLGWGVRALLLFSFLFIYLKSYSSHSWKFIYFEN